MTQGKPREKIKKSYTKYVFLAQITDDQRYFKSVPEVQITA